ncbi:S1 family peptidase [Aliivibrio kagoshimensis]|uniref:S1 family peptidase n=1 Tax=Aliivibrio kagoshimensis TaxID=2910230 RepID=UPI003D0CBA2F
MLKIYLALMGLVLSTSSSYAALPDTIDKVKPSIVAIGTYNKLRTPKAVILGTGFVVANGKYVATNAHVVPKSLNKNENEILMAFQQHGSKVNSYPVEVVTKNAVTDLAILRLTNNKLTPLTVSKKSVREGELYAFTGFPIGAILGLTPVTHRGIVSSITPIAIPARSGKELTLAQLKQLRDPYKIYQLDATAYPGNSGSPLYHPATGEVVAIINKVFVKGSKESALTDPSAITYAIPVKHLQKLINTHTK